LSPVIKTSQTGQSHSDILQQLQGHSETWRHVGSNASGFKFAILSFWIREGRKELKKKRGKRRWKREIRRKMEPEG